MAERSSLEAKSNGLSISEQPSNDAHTTSPAKDKSHKWSVRSSPERKKKQFRPMSSLFGRHKERKNDDTTSTKQTDNAPAEQSDTNSAERTDFTRKVKDYDWSSAQRDDQRQLNDQRQPSQSPPVSPRFGPALKENLKNDSFAQSSRDDPQPLRLPPVSLPANPPSLLGSYVPIAEIPEHERRKQVIERVRRKNIVGRQKTLPDQRRMGICEISDSSESDDGVPDGS